MNMTPLAIACVLGVWLAGCDWGRPPSDRGAGAHPEGGAVWPAPG